MKQLKRLNLKKCTTLNGAEMKQIVGGNAIAVVTCAPKDTCSGFCQEPGIRVGECINRDVNNHSWCVCVPK